MKNQKEIWKDIPNYEGYYQVSNLGRVKSLKRFIKAKNNSLKLTHDRIIRPGISRGYSKVILCIDKKRKSFTVHQLVVITFLNHKPLGMKKVVNHINFKKSDNRVENLEIITQRENANRKHLNSTSKYVGVYFSKEKNRWKSQIVINKKTISLGSFKKEIDAHLAYQSKLKEINMDTTIS